MESQGHSTDYTSNTIHDSAGQSQLRREEMNQGQGNYFQKAGDGVMSMAQGAATVAQGAVQGATSLAQGAAYGAANVAQGAASAVKNTLGMGSENNPNSNSNNSASAAGGKPNARV